VWVKQWVKGQVEMCEKYESVKSMEDTIVGPGPGRLADCVRLNLASIEVARN
jgi:hypothetical protein